MSSFFIIQRYRNASWVQVSPEGQCITKHALRDSPFSSAGH